MDQDPHLLTMTAYPPGPGPYERWEVTTPAGEVLISGTTFPVDQDAVREACAAYHKRIDTNEGTETRIRDEIAASE